MGLHHVADIAAHGDAGQVDLGGDLLAGKALPRVGGQKLPDHGQGGQVQPLAQLGGRGRGLGQLDEPVNGLLVHPGGVLGQQALPLEKAVHGLAEPGQDKGLDEIVQHPPLKQGLDDVRVVGGGDGNDGGGGAGQGQQPVQKLLAVHLGGIVIQNDQIGPVVG